MKDRKVAIITGAAGGIGAATAKKFAAHHFRLALVDTNEQALDELARDLEETGETEYMRFSGDLEQVEQLEEMICQVFEHWGRIDVVINNAAWRSVETMRQIDLSTWEKTVRICLTAPAFLAKWAAEKMENRKEGGVVINLSSVMAGRAGGTSPAYIACKGALESLTYELAALYGPRGIRVVAVCPGNIETNLSNDFVDAQGGNISSEIVQQLNQQVPLQRSGTPREIADACYWLSTDEASFITGTTLVVDGGFSHNFNSYQLKKKQFPKEF
ncbi:SDR family NAD(P)-dependent oxidoreductase [Niabella aurantiaca]|uniref:SDR family NAD(P)-dependent oxidoreductase n=1 Tax=Niabella aurantiaca TaxID=379900 RepID=UPI00037A3C82|nr:SDR family oxidoreductase [Niabella aurantiaca]